MFRSMLLFSIHRDLCLFYDQHSINWYMFTVMLICSLLQYIIETLILFLSYVFFSICHYVLNTTFDVRLQQCIFLFFRSYIVTISKLCWLDLYQFDINCSLLRGENFLLGNRLYTIGCRQTCRAFS